MKKRNIVKKNEDFSRIIKTMPVYRFPDYFVYLEHTDEKNYHFGISISKKIGNAVTRNKIKRRIKSILDQYDYKNNFNCIIIVRKSILKSSFLKMNQDLEKIIIKLNIVKEKKHEEKK